MTHSLALRAGIADQLSLCLAVRGASTWLARQERRGCEARGAPVNSTKGQPYQMPRVSSWTALLSSPGSMK